MKIRHSLEPGDGEVLAALMAELGWGPRTHDAADFVLALLSGSSWFALAEVDGRVAGYVRAISDGIVVTYVPEVAVAPPFRRQGIGSALIRACLDAFAHTAIYADVAPAAVPLMERLGVRPRPAYLVACARGPQATGSQATGSQAGGS